MKKDAIYKKAKALVLKDKNFSPSYVQRKLEIGYNRAVKIVEHIKNEQRHSDDCK
ncbi:hypothetical protein MNB_SV-5-247 [hydrothermal vent metagenome]|uniref:FtsK gamma domain-containing protein n=1 Tax=hydrothermal vent metagenome TaxID=652676 RepID=A0A1W1EEZ4_9ZZZZ